MNLRHRDVDTEDNADERALHQLDKTLNTLLNERLPYLLALGIATDDTVHDWRLAGFCVCVLFTDSVHLDIFGIINLDELFVDVRAIGPRVIQCRVELAGFISHLRT